MLVCAKCSSNDVPHCMLFGWHLKCWKLYCFQHFKPSKLSKHCQHLVFDVNLSDMAKIADSTPKNAGGWTFQHLGWHFEDWKIELRCNLRSFLGHHGFRDHLKGWYRQRACLQKKVLWSRVESDSSRNALHTAPRCCLKIRPPRMDVRNFPSFQIWRHLASFLFYELSQI